MNTPGVDDPAAAPFPSPGQPVLAVIRMEGSLHVWPVEILGDFKIDAGVILSCSRVHRDCTAVLKTSLS